MSCSDCFRLTTKCKFKCASMKDRYGLLSDSVNVHVRLFTILKEGLYQFFMLAIFCDSVLLKYYISLWQFILKYMSWVDRQWRRQWQRKKEKGKRKNNKQRFSIFIILAHGIRGGSWFHGSKGWIFPLTTHNFSTATGGSWEREEV